MGEEHQGESAGLDQMTSNINHRDICPKSKDIGLILFMPNIHKM